jgi:hypothetical protein
MKNTFLRFPSGIILIIILFAIFAVSFTGAPVQKVYAFSMSNGNFTIQGETSNPTDQDIINSGKSFKQHASMPAGTAKGSGYTIISGFSGSVGNDELTISASPILIDFGQLSATNPVIRTTVLSIRSSSCAYQVFSYENAPLTSENNNVIPDTTCDNGSCDEETGAAWTNTLTYGFGYRCDNLKDSDCQAGFSQGYFKQFADILNKQDPVVFMTGLASSSQKQGQITYKVNVSGTQQPDSYSNTVTYMLVPSF